MYAQIFELFFNYTLINLFVTLLLFCGSFYLSKKIIKFYNLNFNISISLFIYHNLFFIVYMIYLYKVGTDALSYFTDYKGYELVSVRPGQLFMYKISALFHLTNLEFYNINYLFSIFSLFCFYLILKIFQDLKIRNKTYFYAIIIFLFIPTFHFWIMGFSKDTITFICITIITYQMLNKKNYFIILFFLILVSCVRLHIGLIVTVCLLTHLIFNIKNNFTKILVFFIGAASILILLKLLVGSIDSFKTIITYLNQFRNQYMDDPNTAIITDSYFIKMFSYLFLPNIFSMRGVDIFFILVTLENTFLMYLVILLFNLESFKFYKYDLYRFNILLFVLSLFLLSYTTSNIGIAIRQKWIFLPSLIIFMSAIKFKKF